jgi:hypothetical protein
LEDALFGTIPSEGWAAHTVESGGLEWLWASPVFVTTNYYKVYPNDTNNQDGPYGGTKFTTNNFPDSIRYSGFRLPTTLQVQQYKPDVPLPNCMAAFANNGSFHCDLGDYLQGDIVTADQGCWHPSCDVVYVRPVGHMDRDYDCDDNDGDGWCNDLDTCVDTPNILQGYAFEVSPTRELLSALFETGKGMNILLALVSFTSSNLSEARCSLWKHYIGARCQWFCRVDTL